MCVFSDGTGRVNIADSLSCNNLYVDAITQIAHLYGMFADKSVLQIRCRSVQQQTGITDCGLFAIAYAVEVCLGRNPEEAIFAQERMRQHLNECLLSGQMRAFPRAAEDCIPRPKSGVVSVELFCLCKLPAQFDTDMISCDLCNMWFHCSCVDVDASNAPKYWECPECS